MLLLATAVVITYSYPPLIHSFAEYWFLLSGGTPEIRAVVDSRRCHSVAVADQTFVLL